MITTDVVLVSACRTAIGGMGGALKDFLAKDLGAIVIAEAIKRAGIAPDLVQEVFMGNIFQAGQGQGPARQAALKAGVPIESPATTVNILCGSGMKSIILAAQAIMLGDADVTVAGGMESMTNAPYLLLKGRFGYRMGDDYIRDSMIYDGLRCAINDYHMGITAENLAEKYSISREEQDQFALESQQKAVAAIAAGRFKDEIVPVSIPQRKGDPIVFDTDEHPKANTTLEGLAKLRPAFKKDGTVTAGNASGINDGAAAMVLMSAKKAQELGVKPIAYLRGYATAGVDPKIMGIGPVPATRAALKMAGLTLDQMDLIEANEAFAAQALAVGRELQWDPAKVNVNGGAIALGHPVGASGARIVVTLLYEMMKRGSRYGLATLCVGGGMGVATVWERA